MAGLRSLITRYRARKARHAQEAVAAIANSSRPAGEKFSQIYERRLWLKAGALSGETESLSGHGSSLRSTQILREDLQKLIQEVRPKIFFDAPCGDFNWMQAVDFPPTCTYVGGDIVSSIIESNRRKFGRGDVEIAGSRVFTVFDLTVDPFPTADIWLCKDCLQHLSLSDVRLSLENFARSSIELALISNHRGVRANSDIKTGDFRHLDLMLPPFNLPPPDRAVRDHPVDGEPRFIAVWTREQVAQAVL